MKRAILCLDPPERPKPLEAPGTVDNVLHALWTRHLDGDYNKDRDKPCWMTLQRFIEEHGGLNKSAADFDPTGRLPCE